MFWNNHQLQWKISQSSTNSHTPPHSLPIEDAQLVKQCIIRPKQPKHVGRQKIWENKLSVRIDKLRSDISKISQMNTSTSSIKIKRNTAEMRNKYKITSEVKRISTLESLKQRLSATSYRLK